MNITIVRRSLKDQEIALLIRDARFFPDIAYVSKVRWKRFSNPYIIEINKSFAGICALYTFDMWVKIGPLELLKKYHRKGLGKYLLHRIIDDYKDRSIILASSNPATQHIAETLEFKTVPNFMSLPKTVRRFLLRQLIEHMNFLFFYEGIRKKFFLKRKNIRYYIKQ